MTSQPLPGGGAASPRWGCCTAAPGCGWGCCSGRRCSGSACSTSARWRRCSSRRCGPSTAFGGNIERVWNLDNYRDLFTIDVYRTITIRTLLIAVTVTVIDALLAFPIALYMAKVASPRLQRALVIAVLTPLWASYLVKAYAWRGMFATGGPLDDLGLSPGYGLVADGRDAVLPVAALHDPADVRRSRAVAELVDRGLRRPRRDHPHHHAPRRAAGALPGSGRRAPSSPSR